jgi:hypothetical protein
MCLSQAGRLSMTACARSRIAALPLIPGIGRRRAFQVMLERVC